MNDENHLTGPFDSFLDNISDCTSSEKLFFTAGIVELLRHAKSNKVGLAMAELLASLPETDWHSVPFSFTKTLLADKTKADVSQCGIPAAMVSDVLLTGFMAFLGRMQAGEKPTEALLQAAVKDVATEVAALYKQPAVVPKKKEPPELFNHWLVKRVFSPEEITDDVLTKLDAKLVYFSAPLGGGLVGPEIRGVAFDNGTNQYFILLESGEFVKVPKTYEHMRLVNRNVLAPDMPTALFLALSIIAEQLEIYAVISKPQFEYIAAGSLGKTLKPIVQAVAAVEDIAALEHVFDTDQECARLGGAGATGPTGATVRFPIPETDLCVVLAANQDAHGPYSTARLVRENETGTDVVLMRHETPRLYSLRGVYLFPLKDRLISLTVIF